MRKIHYLCKLKTRNMIVDTNKSSDRTSFYGITIDATPNQLKQILGEKEQSVSGDNKVNMGWCKEIDGVGVFTIYDYKYYRNIADDEKITWNIGGHNKKVTEIAKTEISKLLNN